MYPCLQSPLSQAVYFLVSLKLLHLEATSALQDTHGHRYTLVAQYGAPFAAVCHEEQLSCF
jgi:hypothetical protein